MTDEPTYRCPRCLDRVFVSHSLRRHGSEYSVAWFCDCDAGRTAETYHWFDACYPVEAGKRASSQTGMRRLEAYLKANPAQRIWLPGAVEQARDRYESARKRKLSELADVKELALLGIRPGAP